MMEVLRKAGLEKNGLIGKSLYHGIAPCSKSPIGYKYMKQVANDENNPLIISQLV